MRQLGVKLPHNSEQAQLLKQIPSAASLYLESRLDDSKRLDLLYSINTKRPLFNYPLPVKLHQSIQTLLTQHPNIPYIWLEYDDINSGKLGTAGFHACVCPNYLKQHHQTPALSDEQVLRVIDHLSYYKLSSRYTQLLPLIQQIREHSKLIHVSYMSQRKPECIKLFVKLPRAHLGKLLHAIKWQGNRELIEKQLNNSWYKEDKNGFISLDLKIEHTLTPYIAVVHSQMMLDSVTDSTKRIYDLIEADIISKDNDIKAVLAWLTPNKQSNDLRWLDIKTTIDEQSQLSSKLYFGGQKLQC